MKSIFYRNYSYHNLYNSKKYNQTNKIYCIEMGCGASHKDSSQPIRISTVTGKLKVTITNAHIDYDASVFKLDPYIVVTLSNQTQKTKVAVKGDKDPAFMETFQFHINSCFKVHGRSLQMRLMDKKKIGSDSQVGFGIVDLDPVVNFKKSRQEFRCFLSHSRQNAGFINMVAQFVEQTSEILSFRFETASIRRKTSTFGSMNCRVRITVGEQVLMTTKQQDTKQSPPIWKDEILSFTVAKSIKECEIQVLDDSEIIGTTKMQIEELMKSSGQQNFNQQFEYDGKVNAGSLKFNTIKGINPIFSQIKVSHRKKRPEDEKKEDQKKVDQKKVDQSKVQQKNGEQNKKPVVQDSSQKKQEPKQQ